MKLLENLFVLRTIDLLAVILCQPSKEAAVVPNPVRLKPYRTFLEVEQPESEFIFRMKDCHGGIGCAFFEADGGAWKIEATQNIKAYLQEELKDLDQFTVIA